MQKKAIFAQKNIFFFVDHILKFFVKLRRIACQEKAESLEAAIGSPPFGLKGFSPLFCRTVFQYCGVRQNEVPLGPCRWSARNMQTEKNLFLRSRSARLP